MNILNDVKVIFSTLALTLISLSLYKVVYYVDHTINDTDHTINETITETEVEKSEDVHEVAISLYIAHSYLIIVFLYNLLISIVLIVGVHKTNTKYMRDYFKAGLFLLLLAVATVVLSTVFLHLFVTVALLKWSVIILYCLIMVRSHYLEVEEANKPSVIEMESLYNPPRASHLYA